MFWERVEPKKGAGSVCISPNWRAPNIAKTEKGKRGENTKKKREKVEKKFGKPKNIYAQTRNI